MPPTPPDAQITTDEHFHAEIDKATKALDAALESFPSQVQQKLQPAEVATVAVRDDLIERLRQSEDADEQSSLRECLKKANVCVSLVVGMEYPQGSVQREPLEQARKLLAELSRACPHGTTSTDAT